MKIINRGQLLEAPSGTVYARYIPDMVDGELCIKVGNNCNLDLIPTHESGLKEDSYRETNWATDDLNIIADYNSSDLFAVFNSTEVKKMIDCLVWALTGCESDFNMDEVIRPNGQIMIDPDWSPFDE